jgi:voltage-gated potassium channel
MAERLLRFEIIRNALSFYRRRVSVLVGSTALLGLIGYASDEAVGLFYISLAAAIFMVTAFHILFGGRSAFFNVIFANMITIYLCLFTFFVESLFQELPPRYITVGFLLPLAAFLGGAVFRKDEIQGIIQSQTYLEEAKFVRSFLWLAPITLIGVVAFTLHLSHGDTSAHLKMFFMMEMSLISAIVFFASRDFTLMLIDTGVLFGDFFTDNARLVKPAFAFFTFYSMIIIIFAGIYKMIERLSTVHHFMVRGVARNMTFIESLYFSMVTLSTLGYGDIVPVTNAIRLIVGIQTFFGTLLFFFGVHAILGHKWDHPSKKRAEDAGPPTDD